MLLAAVVAGTVVVAVRAEAPGASRPVQRLVGMVRGAYVGPVAWVDSFVGHRVCVGWTDGFVCTEVEGVRATPERFAGDARPVAVPTTARVEIANSGRDPVAASVDGASTEVLLAVRAPGETPSYADLPGADPATGYARGACDARLQHRLRIPAKGSVSICVRFEPFADALGAAGARGARTTSHGYSDPTVTGLTVAGVAAWALPAAQGPGGPLGASPAQAALRPQLVVSLPAVAVEELDSGVPLAPAAAAFQSSYAQGSFAPGSDPRWTSTSRFVHPGPVLVRMRAVGPSGQPGELAVRDVFADGTFGCTRTGCSLLRVAGQPVPARARIAGCGRAGGYACFRLDAPPGVDLGEVSFEASAGHVRAEVRLVNVRFYEQEDPQAPFGLVWAPPSPWNEGAPRAS